MRSFSGRMIDSDIFGRKLSKKQIQREVLEENKQRGRNAEDMYRMNAAFRGVEVERSPHGQDFIERERNPWTGKVTKTTHVEVKSSATAPLSPLQEKTMKSKRNYKVKRFGGLF